MSSKFDTPHQPTPGLDSLSTVELHSGREFEKALLDLEGFDFVWLIWWFHRNRSWRPKVLPPRGPSVKRGVFATRSPHRPNPIGISAVKLVKVDGRTLTIGNCDLVDGTPILDIKPYVPEVDSFPNAEIGWLREVQGFYAAPPGYHVVITEGAQKQLQWLSERGVQFIERAKEILERDPSENRSRRIKRHDSRLFRMGCAEWRIFFTVSGREVVVEFIRTGYTKELLLAPGAEVIREHLVLLDFLNVWPEADVHSENAIR